jgi:hypothetical protein
VKSVVFGWRTGSRLAGRLDPQDAGERLESIRRSYGGALTAAAVVTDARQQGSLLHGVFEWDDREAAEEYRLVQARELIRGLVVVVSPTTKRVDPVRAFVSVSAPSETRPAERVYTSLQDALADPARRAEVLSRARHELTAFRQKYAALKELAPVMGAIDDALAESEEEAAQ